MGTTFIVIALNLFFVSDFGLDFEKKGRMNIWVGDGGVCLSFFQKWSQLGSGTIIHLHTVL